MKTKIDIRDLTVVSPTRPLLRRVTMTVHEREILAIIGPAHGGKSTLLRCLNRMIELRNHVAVSGSILIDGTDIHDPSVDVHRLRRRIGMIYPVPLPLPMSILDNMCYGPRLHGEQSHTVLLATAERCLRAAGLWEEVKDRLHMSAMRLSGGQQQRLCLARMLTVEPDIILFDEPCSGLDPISTANVEHTMKELSKQYTVILVTNMIRQAERVSDRTAFFLNGELIEIGKTPQLFRAAKDRRTRDYISGKFG